MRCSIPEQSVNQLAAEKRSQANQTLSNKSRTNTFAGHKRHSADSDEHNFNLSSISSAQDASIIQKYGLHQRSKYYNHASVMALKHVGNPAADSAMVPASAISIVLPASKSNAAAVSSKKDRSPSDMRQFQPSSSNQTSINNMLEDGLMSNQLVMAAKYSSQTNEKEQLVTRDSHIVETFYKQSIDSKRFDRGNQVCEPGDTLSNFNPLVGSTTKRSKVSSSTKDEKQRPSG